MRVGFLLTARLKSARLPRKVLLALAGRPATAHLLDRVKRARRIETIVVCTSTNAQDDPLEALAAQEGVHCYRGSEGDVLLRLYEAAAAHGLDYVANITADCPLVDPVHIDWIVEGYEATGADLVTASKLPTGQGPNGLKVEALGRVCELKAETETETRPSPRT
jgi:spore coat polysaccharide biosynthesis protein SpsF